MLLMWQHFSKSSHNSYLSNNLMGSCSIHNISLLCKFESQRFWLFRSTNELRKNMRKLNLFLLKLVGDMNANWWDLN